MYSLLSVISCVLCMFHKFCVFLSDGQRRSCPHPISNVNADREEDSTGAMKGSLDSGWARENALRT